MPATTNFLQFNPGLTNAQTDSQALSDSMRLNGAPLGSLFPAVSYNKLAHQWSMFPAAFCTMLAQKGFSTSDVNFNDLVAALMNVLTTADQKALIVSVPYATAVEFNASLAAEFDLVLTGSVASSTLTHLVPGQLLIFSITQDATGNRTFAWPATIQNPGAIAPQPSTTSLQMFLVRADGTTIIPASPMLWISASGLVVTPLPAVVSISASGDIASTNQEILELVSAGSSAITRNVYSAVGRKGFIVRIKKTDTTQNAVNLAPKVAGQTIDGYPTVSIVKQNDSLSMMADGANWQIF